MFLLLCWQTDANYSKNISLIFTSFQCKHRNIPYKNLHKRLHNSKTSQNFFFFNVFFLLFLKKSHQIVVKTPKKPEEPPYFYRTSDMKLAGNLFRMHVYFRDIWYITFYIFTSENNYVLGKSCKNCFVLKSN